jgi:hypothetical protein
MVVHAANGNIKTNPSNNLRIKTPNRIIANGSYQKPQKTASKALLAAAKLPDKCGGNEMINWRDRCGL